MRNHFTPLEILGLIVFIAAAFVAVHFLVSWGFMYFFAFPALHFVESIQKQIWPLLSPFPLGGFLAIGISVVAGFGAYALLLGAVMFFLVKIWIRIKG